MTLHRERGPGNETTSKLISSIDSIYIFSTICKRSNGRSGCKRCSVTCHLTSNLCFSTSAFSISEGGAITPNQDSGKVTEGANKGVLPYVSTPLFVRVLFAARNRDFN